MSLDGCIVKYFDFPGRGDALRLALALGGVNFVDERVPFGDWRAVKPTTPFGSLPTLTLPDGTALAQQRSLLRFVGRSTGLYPAEPLAALKVDELMDAVEDLVAKTFVAGKNKPKEEMEAERLKETTDPEGSVTKLLGCIEAFLAANNAGGPFALGAACTVADLHLYATTSMLTSGTYDGVPPTILEPFPNICAVRKAVRSMDVVKAWYAEHPAKSPAYGEL